MLHLRCLFLVVDGNTNLYYCFRSIVCMNIGSLAISKLIFYAKGLLPLLTSFMATLRKNQLNVSM